MDTAEKKTSLNFIEKIIEKDISNNKNDGKVITRFPPEPNGYLHIGHAKSICLNFGIAQKYGGYTNLRFDDTNPTKEDIEYVNSIKQDVEWLGFQWKENKELYASDYFENLYQAAVTLIKKGLAYVDDSTPEEIAIMKGTPTKDGVISPYFTNRTIEENLDLFDRMKKGEFEEGTRILRARIDMTSPNMHMRDPIIYRIKKATHHKTGDAWNVYPMYDFAHGISDSIEGITHSLCTLEFEVHRPLYEWFLDALEVYCPQQIEFARLNLNYTIMSKRKLLQLVENNHVDSWDDPRMPTVSGMRRRGYTAAAIRNFADKVGIARRENIIDIALLEFSVREDLNKITDRVMAVLDPLKVVITNFPDDLIEELPIVNNPQAEAKTERKVPFTREIYIEREDFMESAGRKYKRMTLERPTRLKGAYIIECEEVIKDENGKITELRCRYFKNSRSGSDVSGIKTKGVIHWVSATECLRAEVRLYDRLFMDENPDGHKEKSFLEFLNPDSLKVLSNVPVELNLGTAKIGETFQFMRTGYFCVDTMSTPEKLVFNRTVGLRDSWAKQQPKPQGKKGGGQQKKKGN